jgi:hypothetical protein
MRSAFLVFIVLFSAICFSQPYNYYFGNLHAHTAFSDGNKDSTSSGISTPSGSYSYAKLSKDFDFLGISEHNHYSTIRNPGFKLPRYKTGMQMADAANEDGKFLALFGMEYGISSGKNGHVIIYGFDQLVGWETSVPGITGNNYNIYNAKSDYDGLFKKVKNNPNAFCYLAHPYYTDYSSNGSDSAALYNAPYNSAYDSAIVGVPLRSGLAMSNANNYDDYSLGNYFIYFKKLLYKGYHLGMGYDHDNHYTNFGRSNGGRLVIIAPQLSKKELMKAMQQMHFYGSDDSNCKIEFTLANNLMGSILTGTDMPVFNLIHNDPDGENADSLKLWRGNANSGGLWADIICGANQANALYYRDTTLATGVEYYYFAEVKQADGQWIVTSPIWYKKYDAPPVVKKETCELIYFVNTITGKLDVSFDACKDHSITIVDLNGRILLTETFAKNNFSVDLSGLPSGIYTIVFKNESSVRAEKLVID